MSGNRNGSNRPLVKNGYQNINFLISQPKTVNVVGSFEFPKHIFKTDRKEKITILCSKGCLSSPML